MSIAYFAQFRTLADIKKEYHRLALLHHPDRGGDTGTMQEINAAYHRALQGQDGATFEDAEGQEYTYHYDAAKEQEVIDFLDRLMASGALQDDVQCLLIGRWVWIRGNTRPVKEILKSLHCFWHSTRECWYWKPSGKRAYYNPKASLESLADAYGVAEIKGRHVQTAPRLA